MKIALLGKGKTGSKILDLRSDVTVFDSKNKPTSGKLQGHEVIISFLPGETFYELIPMLLETGIPVVTGSTGFHWPSNIDQILKEKNAGWIYASNFSIGVFVIKQLMQTISKYASLFENKKISIHEIHHTQKKDAPSGTALSMRDWLNLNAEMSSERTGDVIGFHEMTLDTGSEKIKISHEALDRKLFAQGAIWAAEYLVKNKTSGLHSFQSIIERSL